MTHGLSPLVRGRTIRLAWQEGPTKGSIHEHVFHEDGTVQWHSVGPAAKQGAPAEGETGRTERPSYLARNVTDQVVLVSYLSPASGYTLTVALDFASHTTIGVASNGKNWVPVEGSFEDATAQG